METSLTVLDSHGDTTISWDHRDAKACEKARKTIADLKAQGYMFFLLDGTPADEIAAGAGKLLVRRLTADQVMDEKESAEHDESKPDAEPSQEQPKRRGRPRKEVVATRSVRGG